MAINYKQMKSKVEEVYTPRAPADRDFMAKHTVHIEPDPWNKDQKWPNSGVKGKSKTRKADREPGEDAKVYEGYESEHDDPEYSEDDADYGDEGDDEGGMAMAQLKAISAKSYHLAAMMTAGMPLEAWVQAKISNAKMMMDDVYDYLHYSEAVEEDEDEVISEVLSKNAKAGEWISDFVHSKNPKFAGKSKKERTKQALAAYYSKQRNEEVESVGEELTESLSAVTVKSSTHHWGKMMTVHHKASHSYPLHPEHQEAIRKLKDGEKTRFEDETGKKVTAHREGDKVHLSSNQSGSAKTTLAHGHFKESIDEETISERDEGKPGLNFKKIASKAAKKYGSKEAGNRVAGTIRKKVLAKEEIELDEAKRGRPKKNGGSSDSESEEGGDSHPIMQLRKVVSTRGQKHMTFKSGEKKEIHPTHAHKVMQMHDNAKTAEHKQEIADRAGKSHESFKDLVAGKPAEPKKPKITLAKFAGKK
jgi:hypothetical protein